MHGAHASNVRCTSAGVQQECYLQCSSVCWAGWCKTRRLASVAAAQCCGGTSRSGNRCSSQRMRQLHYFCSLLGLLVPYMPLGRSNLRGTGALGV